MYYIILYVLFLFTYICVLLLLLFHVTAYFSTTYYLILLPFIIQSTVLLYEPRGLDILFVVLIHFNKELLHYINMYIS